MIRLHPHLVRARNDSGRKADILDGIIVTLGTGVMFIAGGADNNFLKLKKIKLI